jgi:vacuolar-type H+-ATPase subunit H
MPEAVREAEWVIREKERILGEAERESQTIVDTAKSKLQRIAGESEIVKVAKSQGDELIENAKKTAREITHGAFSYADDVMSQLQVQLENSMQVVKQGREEIRQNLREKKAKE